MGEFQNDSCIRDAENNLPRVEEVASPRKEGLSKVKGEPKRIADGMAFWVGQEIEDIGK